MTSFFARGLLRRSAAQCPGDAVAPDLVPGAGRLALAAVCLDPVLEDVTAVAEPGSLVAVVSENRAARCALLAVAAGLVEPNRGHVSLDGQNLAQHSVGSVRRAVVLVSANETFPPHGGGAARLLLVDDPPARLDAELSAWRGRATVLVATHRRELVAAADSIWLLERGRIVESGPPRTLLGRASRTGLVLNAEETP